MTSKGRRRACGLVLGIVFAISWASPAETGKPFSIDDYLLTKSARVEDMTRDGRFVAAIPHRELREALRKYNRLLPQTHD